MEQLVDALSARSVGESVAHVYIWGVAFK